MPSFGRPLAPRKLLDAPGGIPPGDGVYVVVNEDDPALKEYVDNYPFWLIIAPLGSRYGDALRDAFRKFPNEPFYGLLDDDYVPITPDWHRLMVEAAGPNGIALANNRVNFPKPYCCRVMGGDLARAIGTIAPGTMRHNYLDDAWTQFGTDFGVLRPLEHVIVEHRHHLFDRAVAKDDTYARGSGDIDEDRVRYQEWLASNERFEQCLRVANLLGGSVPAGGRLAIVPDRRSPEVASPSIIPGCGPDGREPDGRKTSSVDLKQVRLVVVTPMGTSSPDVAYHQSYLQFLLTAIQVGGFGHLNLRTQCGGSHVGKVRETLLWQAWAEDPTHILFIDDDMGFPPRLPLRLLAADVDFAAVPGVRKQDKLSLCCNFLPNKQTFHPVNGFIKVRDVGFAFVLLKRTVIERLIAAYPELRYDAGEGKIEHALFLDMIDDQAPMGRRERLSEDLSFCRRWTAIGGEIWLDTETALVHAGRKEYRGSLADVFGAGNHNLNLDIVNE